MCYVQYIWIWWAQCSYHLQISPKLKLFRLLKSLFIQKPQELKCFEKRLQYTFGNTYYLEKSLTHRSIQNHHAGNYERLEFLGDAIIDQVVSNWLFTKYPKFDEFNISN